MSQSKKRHQAERWLQTAEEDLRAATILFEAEMYAQACFHAQQSGEKSVKAIWYLVDAEPWGHSVQRLIAEFPRRAEIRQLDSWIEHGALLDKYYIPTRYPDGLPDLTPGQAYRRADATRGLDSARALLESCKSWLAEHTA